MLFPITKIDITTFDFEELYSSPFTIISGNKTLFDLVSSNINRMLFALEYEVTLLEFSKQGVNTMRLGGEVDFLESSIFTIYLNNWDDLDAQTVETTKRYFKEVYLEIIEKMKDIELNSFDYMIWLAQNHSIIESVKNK